eukprot:1996221-Lingulodinium_polyedra.AAC.1
MSQGAFAPAPVRRPSRIRPTAPGATTMPKSPQNTRQVPVQQPALPLRSPCWHRLRRRARSYGSAARRAGQRRTSGRTPAKWAIAGRSTCCGRSA